MLNNFPGSQQRHLLFNSKLYKIMEKTHRKHFFSLHLMVGWLLVFTWSESFPQSSTPFCSTIGSSAALLFETHL